MDLIKYMIGLHDFVWFLISLFFFKGWLHEKIIYVDFRHTTEVTETPA